MNRSGMIDALRGGDFEVLVVGGGLGRLGALLDACVGQHGRLPVCAGQVWCQYRTWARWRPP